MTARSDLATFRTLGARLQSVGVPAAASPPSPPPDLRAAAQRLRAALDPEYLTDEQRAAWARRYSGAAGTRGGRMSGWRQTPQCKGCKRILKRPGISCPSCGFLDGAGYLGVASPVSIWERHR